MTAKIKRSSRFLAMEALSKIEKSQAYSNLELNARIEENKLSRSDAKLLTNLVYGVTQRKLSLDFYLQAFIQNKKLDNWLRQLLRLSVYQAIYLDRIPYHAIVNEAVNIAKVKGHQGTANLVNAILRNFQREDLADIETIPAERERLSVKYSLPRPILDDLINDYGQALTEDIAASFLEKSYTSVRVNDRYLSRGQAIESLTQEGFEVEASSLSYLGIRAKKGQLSESKLFKQGWITIQDESSMMVVEALDLKSHHCVLDACAAPGGKTSQIANQLDQEAGGRVYAGDIHDHKLKLIKDNAHRQGFQKLIQTQKMDAKKADHFFEKESFDRILVDAPCSGIGLLKRKPDIKYTKSRNDFIRLHEIQLEILKGVAPLVRNGGRLVYSTCTILSKENEDVIRLFLEEETDFQLASIRFKDSILKVESETFVKILPHEFGTDGFFICALEKNKKA